MDKEKRNTHNSSPAALRIAALAVLIAVTAVFTYMIRIPIAPTRGYINFGDVAIFFTALTFGPVTALITGGLGTALADIISGYAQWAPFSFLAHGLQGLVIALIAGRVKERDDIPKLHIASLLPAFLAGTLVMGGIYFVTGGFMVGFPAATAEIPGNILQNAAGVVVGAPLALAVKKAYPPIERFRW
ncbi:MAG: ECF transporter S component [Spirochaetaceae bacterium]